MKPAIFLAAISLLCVLVTVPVDAQTVVNPRTVEFDPSADHGAMTADNQPVVQRYELEIYLVGAAQPVTTTSLGKPGPQADGKIRVDFSTLVAGWPLADGNYEARVTAVGPAGNASSDPSNTFTFTQAAPGVCIFALSAASLTFTEVGGLGTVTVTTASGCTWAASGGNAWLTLNTGGGTGTGVVTFNVAANGGSTSRSATLTVAGQAVTVTQGAPCAYALSPSSQSFSEVGGSGTFTVTAAAGCGWTVTGGGGWVTVGTASGGGNGAVSFTVAANTAASARSTTLVVGGQAFTITQAAASCSYALSSAVSKIFPQTGGSDTVSVTCGSSCTWTASSDATWVTVAAGSGKGPGTVGYSVAKNSYPTARTATITIGGKAYIVNQAAANRPTAPKKVRLTIGG